MKILLALLLLIPSFTYSHVLDFKCTKSDFQGAPGMEIIWNIELNQKNLKATIAEFHSTSIDDDEEYFAELKDAIIKDNGSKYWDENFELIGNQFYHFRYSKKIKFDKFEISRSVTSYIGKENVEYSHWWYGTEENVLGKISGEYIWEINNWDTMTATFKNIQSTNKEYVWEEDEMWVFENIQCKLIDFN